MLSGSRAPIQTVVSVESLKCVQHDTVRLQHFKSCPTFVELDTLISLNLL